MLLAEGGLFSAVRRDAVDFLKFDLHLGWLHSTLKGLLESSSLSL